MRNWNSFDMMQFCIRHNLYTGGDVQHYEMMLDFVRNSKPTEDNIRLVATDIVMHSYENDGTPFSIYTFGILSDVRQMMDFIAEEVIKGDE